MTIYNDIDNLFLKLDDKWDYDIAYRILDRLKVIIDEDPINSGLDVLNSKIARVTNFKDYAVRLFKKSTIVDSDIKRNMELTGAMYDIKKNKLLQTNLDVKKGSSATERSAIADTILEEEIKKTVKWKDKQIEMESFKKCVAMEIDKLKEIRETLSRQFSIIEKEIELGLIDKEYFLKMNKGGVNKLKGEIKIQCDVDALI